MLKFFKRQKSRSAHSSCADVADTENGNKRQSLRSTSSFCDEVFLEEFLVGEEDGSSIGLSLGAGVDEDIFSYVSRLSMSLLTIVKDPECLSYFVQYLETKNALPLIKFYLDTGNFKAVAETQYQLEKEQHTKLAVVSVNEQHDGYELAQSYDEHSDVGKDVEDDNNSVPELKTLCDLSMRKPLTDDEKSQIYAETNKQITKCNNHNNNIKQKSDTVPNCDSTDMQICAFSIKDAMAIYQKYLIANANQFVRLPVAIISQISLLLCKSNEQEIDSEGTSLHISANCFVDAQQYVLEKLESDYLNDFLQSIFYCKYCVELIEAEVDNKKNIQALTVYDILYSEVALFFFMEFLEQHDERDCLDFWTTAINFRKSFNGSENECEAARADAMIIYEKFFSLQADCRLWMSDKLRCRVEERICAHDQVEHAFDLPLQVTAKYLEKKYFTEFLKSQLFENYLNELKTKIHEELSIGTLTQNLNAGATSQHKLSLRRINKNKSLPSSSVSRHRKTMSDCSDLLKHISQQNTLLAMRDDTSGSGSTHNLKHVHSAVGGKNLCIDSRQLTNPNMLWQRSSTFTTDGGGLKFGRVNSLGRYERDFDTFDSFAINSAAAAASKHTWSLSGNKIKNAMRKLVNLPEDKVQEEIAWQVAEMIVKDVTSVTLNNGLTK